MKRILIFTALLAVALTACQPAPTRQTLEPTSAGGKTASTGYPAPVPVEPGAYPAAGATQEQETMNELWMAYPPVPVDDTLDRGTFLVESAVLTPAGAPDSYDLSFEGSLPTGCNMPRVLVNPPDAQGVIQVEAYSVTEPGMVCADMILPFAGKVATLAGFPPGTYTVLVNGEVNAGKFTVD